MELYIVLYSILAVFTFGPVILVVLSNRKHDLEVRRKYEEADRQRLERLAAQGPRQVEQSKAPEKRPIETYREYEFRSAEIMRGLGFLDAQVTSASRDGGIDVVSAQAVAQCKMHKAPVGTPDLQKFYGATMAHGEKAKIFFSASGYTGGALRLGNEMVMALFTLTPGGHWYPNNGKAMQVMRERSES